MPPKKREKQTTIIERMGLENTIIELYEKGVGPHQIYLRLKDSGVDISEFTLKYWIRTRLTEPKKDKRKKLEEKENNTTIADITPDTKLKEAIDEAWKNYEKAMHDAKPGEASGWFKHYNELLEKALKSAGTYEKAKQEAQKDEDKKIEIVWVIRTVCEMCGATIKEEVQVHNVVNTADTQVEDAKQKMGKELLGDADSEAPNVHP